MKKTTVNIGLAKQHGLSKKEFDSICKILGRVPNLTELGVFSVMWSEHCSYKSSIKYLKTLPQKSENVIAEAGEENAGALDIGDGKAVVFKIESHNHPSALEPFQGAATGIGGILRDVFTMGARPIAALDSLRFGELSEPKQQHLFNGVVEGIARYGNCFGVPTVGGEVVFDAAFAGNCLVNVMAVGIVDTDKIMPAKASGIGNPVLLLGASTGRDGIHGATFASVELSEKSQEDRSSVQIGDPFLEKLLMEATLEIIDKGLAVGIQDMGAAGITCSSSEMAAAGGVGIEIDLDRVPLREDGMTTYEILLSESQERMLVIGIKGKEDALRAVAEKWELNIAKIGEVISGDRFRCKWRGDTVCDIPAKALALGGGTPVYDRQHKRPDYLDKTSEWAANELPLDGIAPDKLLRGILAMPTIASKRWVFEQYDHQVGTDTVIVPGRDAALMRVEGTGSFLALSTDCNGRYCYLDPYMGALQAVAESARNVIATGATPIGITNCLNFGNPERPESFWPFVEAIRGMSDGCRAYKIPVTGGNVSFYNESPSGTIFPTPVIGMVGKIEAENRIIRQHLSPDMTIYIAGQTDINDLGGSALQKYLVGEPMGKPPAVDMDIENRAARFIWETNERRLIESCHDLSDGGLAVALAESCIWGSIGAKIDIPPETDPARFLFSESQGRYLIGIKHSNTSDFEECAKDIGIITCKIGESGGNSLVIPDADIRIEINELNRIYYNAIPDSMKGEL